MILTTIWTMKGMSLKERIRRTKDCLALSLAGRLPARVRYWVVVVEGGRAAINKPVPYDGPDGVTLSEIMEDSFTRVPNGVS